MPTSGGQHRHGVEGYTVPPRPHEDLEQVINLVWAHSGCRGEQVINRVCCFIEL